MYRTALSFYLVVHVLPFIYVAGYHSLSDIVVVLTILAAFPIGILCGVLAVNRGQAPANVVPSVPVVFPIILVAFFYFLVRAESIAEIAEALGRGEYFAYALSLAEARYASGSEGSVLTKLGMILFFLYAMLIGYHAAATGLRGSVGFIAIFVVMIAVESSSLARAGVVIGLVSAFVEFLIRRSREFYLIPRRKLLMRGLVTVSVMAGIFAFSAYFRVQGREDAWIIVAEKAAHYAAAPYSALVTWLDQYGDESLGMGTATFAFVYKLLGIEYAQGAYERISTPLGSVNIYLIYRGLIEDFSLVGAAAVLWLIGAMTAIYTFNSTNIFGYLFLRAGLLLIFFPFYSVFYFSTFAIAFILFHLIFYISVNRQVNRCLASYSMGQGMTFTRNGSTQNSVINADS